MFIGKTTLEKDLGKSIFSRYMYHYCTYCIIIYICEHKISRIGLKTDFREFYFRELTPPQKKPINRLRHEQCFACDRHRPWAVLST